MTVKSHGGTVSPDDHDRINDMDEEKDPVLTPAKARALSCEGPFINVELIFSALERRPLLLPPCSAQVAEQVSATPEQVIIAVKTRKDSVSCLEYFPHPLITHLCGSKGVDFPPVTKWTQGKAGMSFHRKLGHPLCPTPPCPRPGPSGFPGHKRGAAQLPRRGGSHGCAPAASSSCLLGCVQPQKNLW